MTTNGTRFFDEDSREISNLLLRKNSRMHQESGAAFFTEYSLPARNEKSRRSGTRSKISSYAVVKPPLVNRLHVTLHRAGALVHDTRKPSSRWPATVPAVTRGLYAVLCGT